MALFLLLLEGFLVLGCYHILTSQKIRWGQLIVAALLMDTCTLFSGIVYRPLTGISILICVTIYLVVLVKEKIAYLTAIIVMFIALISSQMSNLLSRELVEILFGFEFDGPSNNISMIIWLAIMMVFYAIGIALMRPVYRKIKTSVKSLEKRVLNVIIGITYFIFIVLYLSTYLITEDLGLAVYNTVLIVVLISIGVAVALLYYSSIKRVELKANEQQLLQLNEYMDHIEAMNLEMRRFKHDYKNVLATMYTYIEEKDVIGLKTLMDEHILPFEETIDSDLSELNKLAYLEDKELKGLISYKLTQAIHRGLHIKITISEKIDKLNMNMVDLCRVVGILVDNAIEEAVNSEKKYVHVLIEDIDSVTIVHIENSLSEQDISISEMFKPNFTTKENHSGLGLYSVSKILNEKEITMETRVEKGNLIQMFSIVK